jgi:hypothetical protein
MAFNLGGNMAIVQPSGWGEVMGGFTGPAAILARSAPFTAGLEAQREREMGMVTQGMADLASNERNRLANDTTLKIAKMRQEEGDETGKRAALASLLASSPLVRGGFAGQVFGVGGEGQPSAVAQSTARLGELNDYNAELIRNRQLTQWWGQGGAAASATALRSLPAPPSVGI